MTRGGLQSAMDFLTTIGRGPDARALSVPAEIDYQALVTLAAERGYTLASDDIARAFRTIMQMRARTAVTPIDTAAR